MPKTKEQIRKYNKEYFARPEVIARAKVRNAERRHVRKAYKRTEAGKTANQKYTNSPAYKARIARNRLKTRYGLTPESYQLLLEEQGHACAICKRSEDVTFHIDHDHATGRLRGVLCGPCNMALGLLKDNAETLLSAIRYLDV